MTDRLADAFRSAVQASLEPKYYGIYEYEIVSGDSASCEAQPTDPTIGLPALAEVPTYVSPAGEKVTYAPSVKVLISFVNGSLARPVVVSSDASKPTLQLDLETQGTATIKAAEAVLDALSVKLGGADALLGVVRQTDVIVCGPFQGTATTWSLVSKSK